MNLPVLARLLIVLGLIFLLAGGAVYLLARLHLPLGRLPGDFVFQRGGLTCVFPLATSILLSVLLTIGLNLLIRWLNR